MANFNDVLVMASGLSTSPDDGSRVTRASDGTPKIARLFGQEIYSFSISYQLLTAIQLAALRAFYTANQYDSAIEFTDPTSLVVYAVKMLGPPRVTRQYNTYYDAEMELIGVLA